MEIKRDFYLNKLIQRQQNGLIKVITGIRRCGKSYLINVLFKNYLLSKGVSEDHIISMAFDSYENEKYCDPDNFFPFVKNQIVDQEPYYLLLDEVQLLGKFESVLNSFLRLPNVDIYVTGSNARFLSKDVITEFSGRGDEIYLQPLCFSEFMSMYEGETYKGWEEYLMFGGLPQVVLLSDPDQKISLLNHLFTETYLSDIIKRHRIRNAAEMEELLDILASNIGSMTNPNKLERSFKSIKKSTIKASTISKYLSYLEDAFLIESARRYDIKGKTYIETPVKYYYTDLGLRNARINFRQIEETHSMENVIYNELRRRGYNVDIGNVATTERNQKGVPTHKQLEIDFVCNKGSKRYYIQSALTLPDNKKMTQELRPLRLINDSFKKIIITKDSPGPFYNDEGILFMNVFDFLLNENSLDF